ncbi:uncharacterized protein I303_103807 [Kwoniella dejecticola CBS 10117]|uniref:[acyl-carrier-protein] S-malonyltransferase n=1 Tax=Kwoniella dejecticola CBS 10117 TaxID=1296121 RepID=A0A1A6A7S7_9TREE|nr:uncharacterized protein I303_03826 [Kwoniella dejecticola CBS 10117]OBR86107.1 hypothetical protein I303_03826 [Kwoniella dejecticola CBS 10117]
MRIPQIPRLVSNPSSLSQIAILPTPTRCASTNAANTDWVTWLKRGASTTTTPASGNAGKCLLFAGLGSYPHTPTSPTPSSMKVWEEASEALLSPDATIGYETRGMGDAGLKQVKGWMRGWVEGRSLEELMKRPDVTAAFILSSSIAILASAQEKNGTPTLLPHGTTHLAGHGFIGTLTALVASGRLDLGTGVRLARIYTSLPPSPPNTYPRSHLTTVLSARHFHSLSSPSYFVPPSPPPPPSDEDDPFPPMTGSEESESESSSTPVRRRRAMQLILDEIHSLQRDWERENEITGSGGTIGPRQEWASAGIINSSKVLVVTGTHHAVLQVIERLQHLNLANPVMDVSMPCPYHTKLMTHAIPKFRDVLERCYFENSRPDGPIVLDPMTTHPITNPSYALLPHLTAQLRWHKTLYRLYSSPIPDVSKFVTVGKGAKGLGIMLRGEIKKRPPGSSPIKIEELTSDHPTGTGKTNVNALTTGQGQGQKKNDKLVDKEREQEDRIARAMEMLKRQQRMTSR